MCEIWRPRRQNTGPKEDYIRLHGCDHRERRSGMKKRLGTQAEEDCIWLEQGRWLRRRAFRRGVQRRSRTVHLTREKAGRPGRMK
jgi:hypothetical protein